MKSYKILLQIGFTKKFLNGVFGITGCLAHGWGTPPHLPHPPQPRPQGPQGPPPKGGARGTLGGLGWVGWVGRVGHPTHEPNNPFCQTPHLGISDA